MVTEVHGDNLTTLRLHNAGSMVAQSGNYMLK